MLDRASLSWPFVPMTLSCALAASLPAHAQGRAALVRDLNPRIQPGQSGLIREIAPGRPLTFFTATATQMGYELWCTDGTASGTRMVKDIQPGVLSSNPRNLTWLDGVLYFLADDESLMARLWRSDGTAAGTWRVSEQLQMWEPRASRIAAVGQRLVVVLDDPSFWERDYWISDGTNAGTQRLMAAERRGSILTQIVVSERGLLFDSWGATGTGPWLTNGTIGGTRALADFWGVYFLASTPQRAFFAVAAPNYDSHLWSTDGTPQGTLRVQPTLPGIRSWRGVGSGGSWSYFGETNQFEQRTMWKSDGTPAGTTMFPALPLDAYGLGALDELLLFLTSPTPNTVLLHRTDGTAAGTRPLRAQPFLRVERPLVTMRGRGWFVADDGVHGPELWVTDGSDAGTQLFLDSVPGPEGAVLRLATDGERLWFAIGAQLWSSDGTVAGTRRVVDLDTPGVGSTPVARTMSPGGMRALGTTASQQDGWWQSDGTTAGTGRLGTGSVDSTAVATWSASYFLAQGRNDATLLRNDAAGTRAVRTIPNGGSAQLLGALGDEVLLVAGTALWRSDGTSTGTREYFRFSAPDANAWGGIALGNVTLFVARNGSLRQELWRTDGTAAGTFSLASAMSQGAYSVRSLVRLANTAVALMDVPTGPELWRTDGTTAGTARVADLSAWPYVRSIVATRDRLFLAVGGEPSFLLAIEGTSGGVRVLADFGSYLFIGIPFGNALLFSHGPELWHSDGTTAGTRMLRDFAPGARGFVGGDAIALPGARRALVSGFSDAAGMELWSTDGTPQGTTLVHDIRPGNLSSGAGDYALAGSTVVFAADDGEHGRELWGIAAPAAVLPIGDGCRDTAGLGPLLRGDDAPLVGNGSFAFELIEAQPGSPLWLALGTRARPTWLMPGCGWFVDDVFLVVGGGVGPNGRARVELPVPNDPALTGTSLYAQAVVAETTLAVSSGVRVLFGTW